MSRGLLSERILDSLGSFPFDEGWARRAGSRAIWLAHPRRGSRPTRQLENASSTGFRWAAAGERGKRTRRRCPEAPRKNWVGSGAHFMNRPKSQGRRPPEAARRCSLRVPLLGTVLLGKLEQSDPVRLAMAHGQLRSISCVEVRRQNPSRGTIGSFVFALVSQSRIPQRVSVWGPHESRALPGTW